VDTIDRFTHAVYTLAICLDGPKSQPIAVRNRKIPDDSGPQGCYLE